MYAQALTPEDIDIRSKESRQSLARMVMNLFEHWKLSTEDQLALLGLDSGSRTTLSRYRKGQPLAPSRDLLERVGNLLSIHKSLRILYPQNRELVYRWMSARNRALRNMTPVEVIKEYGFSGLLMVRAYLDHERGQ